MCHVSTFPQFHLRARLFRIRRALLLVGLAMGMKKLDGRRLKYLTG
jgi:hypothetical protein